MDTGKNEMHVKMNRQFSRPSDDVEEVGSTSKINSTASNGAQIEAGRSSVRAIGKNREAWKEPAKDAECVISMNTEKRSSPTSSHCNIDMATEVSNFSYNSSAESQRTAEVRNGGNTSIQIAGMTDTGKNEMQVKMNRLIGRPCDDIREVGSASKVNSRVSNNAQIEAGRSSVCAIGKVREAWKEPAKDAEFVIDMNMEKRSSPASSHCIIDMATEVSNFSYNSSAESLRTAEVRKEGNSSIQIAGMTKCVISMDIEPNHIPVTNDALHRATGDKNAELQMSSKESSAIEIASTFANFYAESELNQQVQEELKSISTDTKSLKQSCKVWRTNHYKTSFFWQV